MKSMLCNTSTCHVGTTSRQSTNRNPIEGISDCSASLGTVAPKYRALNGNITTQTDCGLSLILSIIRLFSLATSRLRSGVAQSRAFVATPDRSVPDGTGNRDLQLSQKHLVAPRCSTLKQKNAKAWQIGKRMWHLGETASTQYVGCMLRRRQTTNERLF